MSQEQEKALQTIKKLLALAKQDNEHEASTAALAAVRLIDKYGLQVSIPGQVQAQDPFPFTGAQTSEGWPKDWWVDFQARVANPAPTPEPKKTKNRAVSIKARYDGYCRCCGKPYDIGDAVQWIPGIGCWCPKCDTEKVRYTKSGYAYRARSY